MQSQKTTQAKITPMEDNEPRLEVATLSSVNNFVISRGVAVLYFLGMLTLKKGKTKLIR